MMLFLPWETWLRLGAWLAVGLVIYFAYGRRHSRIGDRPGPEPVAPEVHVPALPVDGGGQ